ncbi:hypothetical protein M0R72_02820 [Candidatus Pacearchaeota archaeon]|jgi:DNA-binding ferritin-like protein|nr:hypothetical protein [Candidatus Pacearchaeota archaeon]
MDHSRVIKRWALSNKDVNSQLVVSESMIDGFFGVKVAADSMDEEACKILSAYVAFTRALYTLHQQNHWEAQAYEDHLLFQRLYEDAQDLADDAAERTMGLCGEVVLEGAEAIAKKFEARIKTLSSLLESSLEIERAFQDVGQNTYNVLKEKEMLTLGLDDLIMSQASQGEVHIYLLQQELKGLGEDMGSVADHAKEIIDKTESLKDIVVTAKKRKQPEYKPKDIIEYIEAALKVRPYEEVLCYIKGLETEALDQVINILMRTNPGLLKKIYVSSITKKGPEEGEIEISVEPPNTENIENGIVLL